MLIGGSSIRAELKALNIQTLPSVRTIERVLQRNGISVPRVQLAKFLPRQTYPGPQAQTSNHLHQVDLVGPIYLKGRKQRYYIVKVLVPDPHNRPSEVSATLPTVPA